MKQQTKYILFLIGLALIVVAFIVVPQLLVKEVTVVFSNGATITAEVADNDWSRQRGLAGHKPLENEEGMLFVFNQKAIQTFWMKGMKFSIDIIWIDEGSVVGFEQNVPVITTSTDEDLPMYRSPVPVQYVLEVRAGFVEEKEMKIGDGVMITID